MIKLFLGLIILALYAVGGILSFFMHIHFETATNGFSRLYIWAATIFWPVPMVVYAIVYVVAVGVSLFY